LIIFVLHHAMDAFMSEQLETVAMPETAVLTGQPRPHVASSEDQGDLRFRRLLERLPVGAYICDAEGLITYFNPHAAELWGRSPRLNHPDDRFCGSFKLFAVDGSPIRHDQSWMALALRDRREYDNQEIIIQHPDGRRVTVLAHATPFFDESEKLLGAVNVLVDISASKRADEALRAANGKLAHQVIGRTAELTELTRHLMRTTEVEKTKLAAELHDEMGSLLTVLSMRLNRLGERVAEVAPGLADEHAQLIDLVRNMVVSQRRIVASLRPVLLDSFGLGVALRHYVEDWGRHTGIQAEADITPAFPTLRANAGLALFRTAQEALTNVARHANASFVRVSLNGEGKRVTMSIEDDGIGVPPGVWLLASSHGFSGMRERLMEFGGQLVVEPTPGGRGTRVSATMPR